MTRSRAAGHGVFGLMLLVLLGCGAGQPSDVDTAAASTAEQTEFRYPLPWPVNAIDRTDEPDSLDFVVSDVPVADGSDICASVVEIRGVVRAEDGVALIEVNLVNGLSYPERETAGCATTEQTIRFVLGSVVADIEKILIVSFSDVRQTFYPVDDGFTECALPDCDPNTGLPATEPGCDTIARDIRERLVGLDLPRRANWNTIACDNEWAVLEIDFGAAACPATGDATNACSGRNIKRAYIHLTDSGFWNVVDWDEDNGCGDVPTNEPMFPTDLCADLLAIA